MIDQDEIIVNEPPTRWSLASVWTVVIVVSTGADLGWLLPAYFEIWRVFYIIAHGVMAFWIIGGLARRGEPIARWLRSWVSTTTRG